MATVKSLKADVSSVSPSLGRLEELWVVCVYMQETKSQMAPRAFN